MIKESDKQLIADFVSRLKEKCTPRLNYLSDWDNKSDDEILNMSSEWCEIMDWLEYSFVLIFRDIICSWQDYDNKPYEDPLNDSLQTRSDILKDIKFECDLAKKGLHYLEDRCRINVNQELQFIDKLMLHPSDRLK